MLQQGHDSSGLSRQAAVGGGSSNWWRFTGPFFRVWTDHLRDSFWFIPSLMAVAASVVGIFMPYLDSWLLRSNYADTIAFLYDSGAEGARSVLGAVAASSITVAATVFSITIATLTLASNQFGPRLLRTFTTDRGVQFALGTFVSTFLYPLLVLRVVRTGSDQGMSAFVPHLSVLLAMVLAVVATGVLIYFVHHVSHLIRAPSIIAAVGHELDEVLDSRIPADGSRGDQDADGGLDGWRVPDKAPVLLRAKQTGYIDAVAESTLAKLAAKRDTVIWLCVEPGSYVYQNEPLARTRDVDCFEEEDTEEVANAFAIGGNRTMPEDPTFGINQLTEIAQRAMSPSINDPFTAMSCVDRLGAALARVAVRPFPDPRRRGPDGRVRLVGRPLTWEFFVMTSFDPIRRYGKADALVLSRILNALGKIADACPRRDRHPPLRAMADTVLTAARAASFIASDQQTVEAAHARLVATLEASSG